MTESYLLDILSMA